MAKLISQTELANLVASLLSDPLSVGEEMNEDLYANFIEAIAKVVCDFCGGEIRNGAIPSDEIKGQWLIGIHGNDSLPADGGVWAEFDPKGELFEMAASIGAQCVDGVNEQDKLSYLVIDSHGLDDEFEALIMNKYGVKVYDKTNEPWTVVFQGAKCGLIKMVQEHWYENETDEEVGAMILSDAPATAVKN
jgi:hypothetical protein